MTTLDNSVRLGGRVVKVYPLLDTPNGTKIARFILEHVSKQVEDKVACSVNCKMFCVWVNPENLDKLIKNDTIYVQGFLSNNAKQDLVLHVIEILNKGN